MIHLALPKIFVGFQHPIIGLDKWQKQQFYTPDFFN